MRPRSSAWRRLRGCASAPPRRPVARRAARPSKRRWRGSCGSKRTACSAAATAPRRRRRRSGAARTGAVVAGAAAAAASPICARCSPTTKPRIRRRAALAIGRTRLPDGVRAAGRRCSRPIAIRKCGRWPRSRWGSSATPRPPTRSTHRAAAIADPLVQGRAAEALGLIGHKAAADADRRDDGGARQGRRARRRLPPDDSVPEGAGDRSGPARDLCAGAARRRTTPLASAVLDADGRPVSHWWPVAYAFQRVGDPKAGAALLRAAQGDGVMTRAFAARGLGAIKERARSRRWSRRWRNGRRADRRCASQAARALGELGARAGGRAARSSLLTTPNARSEPATRSGHRARPAAAGRARPICSSTCSTDRWPSMRAAALTGAGAHRSPRRF